MNGEENEWLVKATNAQYSIKDSIAKVNGYGTSEDVIKLITDNAFDDFVNFVRKGFTTILNKVKSASELFTVRSCLSVDITTANIQSYCFQMFVLIGAKPLSIRLNW